MQTSCFSFSRWNFVNRKAAGVIFEKEEMYKSTFGVVCGDMFFSPVKSDVLNRMTERHLWVGVGTE